MFALALLGCTRDAAAPAPQGDDLIARVNGKPIARLELELRLQGRGHPGGEMATADKEAAFEALVVQELLAQKALLLKLDHDPDFRRAMAPLEAQLADARRQQLARLLLEKDVKPRAQVSEAEARAYFEMHRSRIGTEVKVSQLLVKGESAIEPLASRLASGEPFDQVAQSLFPPLPGGEKSWQLDFLSWQLVPEAWWPELERLQVGQISGVIAGPGGRSWILRLDGRRENTSMTFERARPAIESLLRGQRFEDVRRETERALKTAATITRLAPLSTPNP